MSAIMSASRDAVDTRGRLEIDRLFTGARLLVIGGTGFLGKLFWLMLLDRFPQIERIYLVVRGKGKQTPEGRFWSSVATSMALDPLRTTHGEGYERFLGEKIVPIDGDVGRPLCGIDPKLVEELSGTLSAVVNVAGVVDFNPPLDEAISANAFGARNLVALTRALGSPPLYHTSTCYVAGRRKGPILEADPREHPFPRAGELDRSVWDAEREIEECLDLIKQARHRADDAFRQSDFLDRAKANLLSRDEPTEGAALEEEIAYVKRKFIEARLIETGLERATHWGWPNIYTYTKSIGEQIVASSGLRFTIVRPACSESCEVFPMVGWNEGINTSAPLIYLVLRGLWELPGIEEPLDFIPADMVVAGMVLSLAELLEGTHRAVYQYGASDVNPCTARRIGELIGLYKRRYYQRTGHGGPLFNWVQKRYEMAVVSAKTGEMIGPHGVARAASALSGVLKATPVAAQLRGVTRSLDGMASAQERIGDIIDLFKPFTAMLNGPFSCANTRAAYERLSPEDKPRLRWAPEQIDWRVWMQDIHMPGLERWVVPEMDEKLARKPRPRKPHTSVASLLRQMAARHEHAIALATPGDEGLVPNTYGEVYRRAKVVAASLRRRGVQPRERVALLGQGSPEVVIALFGVMLAGAAVLPIDGSTSLEDALDRAAKAGAKVLLLDGAMRTVGSEGVTLVPLSEVLEGEAPDEIAEPGPDDDAVVVTTSKGAQVALSHRMLTSLVAALQPAFPLGTRDRLLSVLPLSSAFEIVCGLLLPFTAGARVVYLDQPTGARLEELMLEARITALVGVPQVWQALERRLLVESDADRAGKLKEQLSQLLAEKGGVNVGRLLFGSLHRRLGGHVRVLLSGGDLTPELRRRFLALGLPIIESIGDDVRPVVALSGRSDAQRGKALLTPLPGLEAKAAGAGPSALLLSGTKAIVASPEGEARVEVQASINARGKIVPRQSGVTIDVPLDDIVADEEADRLPDILPRDMTLPWFVQAAGKRVLREVQRSFYAAVMKVHVTGRPFIPQNRNVIVVANHASHLDMGLVKHALGPYGEGLVALAAQDYFFEENTLRKAYVENFTNVEPLDRKGGFLTALRKAAEIIARGETVLIFPEGTRSTDGTIRDFRPLLGQLVLQTEVDILPVWLGGTHDAMPKGSRLPSRRELEARIGLPLVTSDLKRLTARLKWADAAREVARLAREAVVTLGDGGVLDLSKR